MIYSLSEGLGQLKRNWKTVICPSQVEGLCRDVGIRWRNRVLNPATTVQLMLLQVLHGNTALSHVRYLTRRSFSPSALCQARKRVPQQVLESLLNRTSSIRVPKEMLWRGRHLYHVDGSTFSVPDTEQLRAHFGQPCGQQVGCGFPMASFVALVHAGTGMIKRVLSGALFSSDISRFVTLHPALKAKDIVVGDRAFGTYVHLALLGRRRVDAVFRVTARKIVRFNAARSGGKGDPTSVWERKLGARDQIVRWLKPKFTPLWMSQEQFAALPAELRVRELAYRIRRKGFRTREVILVTTLLDSRISVEEFAALYHQRWNIETCFDHLKTSMGMDALRCRSIAGVLKEFTCFCIVYNLVRAVMLVTAQRLGTLPNRVSFTDAMRWLLAAAARRIFLLPQKVPSRPNRFEPRAIKRRPKPYDWINKPRAAYALP